MADRPDIPAVLGPETPGYRELAFKDLIVTLDGVEQTRVISYDLHAGAVTRFAENESGRIKLVAGHAGLEAARETLHGNVQAFWPTAA